MAEFERLMEAVSLAPHFEGRNLQVDLHGCLLFASLAPNFEGRNITLEPITVMADV